MFASSTLMAPAVIDLTGTPEPDDFSPAAKSALNGFQPRKQKDGHTNINRAASQVGLNGFQAREDSRRSTSVSSGTPFGVFVPLVLDPNPQEHHHVIGNGHAHTTLNGWSPLSTPAHQPTQVQKDSLASLLRRGVVATPPSTQNHPSPWKASAQSNATNGSRQVNGSHMTASASKTHTGSSRRYTDVTGTFEDERVQLSPSAGVGARSAFSSANVPSAKRRRVDDPPAYISPSARFQERTQPVALTASQPVPVNAHSFRPTRPTQSIQPVQPTQPTQPAQPAQPTQPDVSSGRHGDVYTPAEDALLVKLKEVEGHHWNTIFSRFPNRTPGSVQVRYSAIKKRRAAEIAKPSSARSKSTTQSHAATPVLEDSDGVGRQRQRRKRNNEASVLSGFISWADWKKGRLTDVDEPSSTERSTPDRDYAQFTGERLHPKSLGRLLRQRELGNGGQGRSVPNELKEHALKSVGPRKYYKGTSGDVVCVAWAPDGNRFAAGSIALTDERSMQYNQSCNLLLGDCERSLLQELPDHHIPRPKLGSDSSNVNALHSMRETQDPRLFMTIASVQFSPDGQTLYSAGSDAKVRSYSVGSGRASLQYELEHSAPLDLISVSNSNILATACHQAADGSIAIFNGPERVQSLSPSRMGPQTDTAIYPSALRWGTAAHHSHYLLAGFSIDSLDAERTDAGEILLWDARAEDRLKVSGDTRNVFDIAWNPNPSPASSVFAVASTRGSEKVSRGTRSVVCCYTGQGNSAAKGIAYECPASDVNDVIYCQYDQNLIAAGATDGKVYVWDQRFARRDCKPLHILEHGATLNVLDHDRERELADTGVRFISWGATGSRLYTGSSDGVVKVWNPYRSTDGAHIKDVATFTSAVMSGAFSPDYRDLLIGEDQGRINWLSVGYDDRPVRSMPRFEMESAPLPVALNERDPPFVAARELLHSSQIALKPMGDLPKRQAVQGPRYQGPFLAASASELQEAQQQYYDALYRQQEAHSTASMIEPNPNDNDDNDDNDQRVQQAEKRFQEAAAKLSQVEKSINDAATLLPQAEANQLALERRARNRLTFDAADESCKLDCNYLPASTDIVPNSQRSEMRIPAALRAIAPPLPDETTDLPHEDLIEAGYTHKCMSCLAAALRPSGESIFAICERCTRRKNGLTASCERCAAPVRPALGANAMEKQLCERCCFACFRCAGKAAVSPDAMAVSCEACGITWSAGVLGYDITRRESKRIGGNLERRESREVLDGAEEAVRLGNRQREYYASLWERALVPHYDYAVE